MAIPDSPLPFFNPERLDHEADMLLIKASQLMGLADRDDVPDMLSHAAITMRLELYRCLRQEAARRRRMRQEGTFPGV